MNDLSLLYYHPFIIRAFLNTFEEFCKDIDTENRIIICERSVKIGFKELVCNRKYFN